MVGVENSNAAEVVDSQPPGGRVRPRVRVLLMLLCLEPPPSGPAVGGLAGAEVAFEERTMLHACGGKFEA
jgi:hypothetical protein